MSTTDEAKANPPADAAAAAAAAAAGGGGDGAAGAYEDVEVLHKLADTLRRTMKIRNGVLQETRVDYFKGRERGGRKETGGEGEEGGHGGGRQGGRDESIMCALNIASRFGGRCVVVVIVVLIGGVVFVVVGGVGGDGGGVVVGVGVVVVTIVVVVVEVFFANVPLLCLTIHSLPPSLPRHEAHQVPDHRPP